MKRAYPIIVTRGENAVEAVAPDFDIRVQGEDIPNAIGTVRDAIGLMGIEMQDNRKAVPEASSLADVQANAPSGGIVSLVDVDFLEYRRKNGMIAVKKNLTIPSWLNYEAERACLSFSSILQEELKKKLNIPDR